MQMTNQQMCQMRKVWKMREIDQNSLTWQQGGRIRTDECRPTAAAPAKGFTCSVLVKLELRSCELGAKCCQVRFQNEQIVQTRIILRNVKALSGEQLYKWSQGR